MLADTQENKGHKTSFLTNFFCKTGYLKDGKFIKHNFTDIENLLEIIAEADADAAVITSSWEYDTIKHYRRDKRTHKIPLIVINGNNQHIMIGADVCVKKVTNKVIQEVTAYSKRLNELWKAASIDELTGAYKREVLREWLEEQKKHERIFSVAFFDIDKFKSINDTYGHEVGDIVLHQFAQFLMANTRAQDFIVRLGGEEFVAVLPDTNARQAYVMIDRLRQVWSEKAIILPDGQILKTTFSAGVAQHEKGKDVIDEADKLMYKAKNSGRNKVMLSRDHIYTKLAILGKVPTQKFETYGYQIVSDPKEADFIVSDIETILAFPKVIISDQINLYVLGTGKPSDLKVKRYYPTALLFKNIESIIADIEGETDNEILLPLPSNIQNNSQDNLRKEAKEKETPKTKISVLPGVRTAENNLTLPKGGVIFIACPSRPGLASELSANLARTIENTALVCAAPESTAALCLGINAMALIESDWRYPGSFAPMNYAGIYVWPVDPYKHSNPISVYDVHRLVEQIKYRFKLVIVDCCGSLSYCSRVAHDEAIIVLRKEGDTSDLATTQWLTNYKGKNVLELSPIEVPSVTEVENGLLISTKSLNCAENYGF